MNRLLMFFFAAAMTANYSVAVETTRLKLTFDFSYNGLPAATVTETVTIDDTGRYEIVGHAAAAGLAKILYGDVHRKSAGVIHKTRGLQMRHYEEKRGRRARQTARYDEASEIIFLTKGDGDELEKLQKKQPPPIYDYLTALYNGYVLQKATGGKFWITDGWRLREYEYVAGEAVLIKTAMGDIEAIPLSRESARGKRIFWLAPSLDYLPIKVYVDDKGHLFETLLTGVENIGGEK